MKYITAKIVLPLVALATFAGCNGWLDVSPKSEVRADKLFESEEGFWEALTGVYIKMGDRALYGGYLSWEGIEFMAWQHANSRQASAWYALQRCDYQAQGSRSFADQVWSQLYNVIAETNEIIFALGEYGSHLDPHVREIIEGECLAIRAYCHFDLMRLFAQGDLKNNPAFLETLCIPYETEYSTVAAKQLTYAETLELLMDDIDRAVELLFEGDRGADDRLFTSTNNMNYDAALLLRARVGLWTGDPGTFGYAKELIDRLDAAELSKWALNNASGGGDLPAAFPSEVLFGINVWDLGKFMETSYSSYIGSAVNDNMLVSSQLNWNDYFVQNNIFRQNSGGADATDTNDIRWHNWYEFIEDYNAWIIGSLSVKVHPEGGSANYVVPLMRISEAWLIAAEACHATNPEQAIEYVNVVRSERGNGIDYQLPYDGSIAGDELLDLIRLEQRREFSQEGQLFYMYKRIGLAQIDESKAGAMTPAKYILPWPETEISEGRVQPMVNN